MAIIAAAFAFPSWFKGPNLGGPAHALKPGRPCGGGNYIIRLPLQGIDPAQAERHAEFLRNVRREPVSVFIEDSKFVVFWLSVGMRRNELCSGQFNTAWDGTGSSEPFEDTFQPSAGEQLGWVVDVLERHGLEPDPPYFNDNTPLEERTWRGQATSTYLRETKLGIGYFPETVVQSMTSEGLTLPDGLVEEAARWVAKRKAQKK